MEQAISIKPLIGSELWSNSKQQTDIASAVSQVQPEIPAELLPAYGFDNTTSLTRLEGGLVNITYLAEHKGNRQILQKLSAHSSESVIDAHMVSSHLARQGWDVPELILNVESVGCTLDNDGNVWRATTFLASDQTIPHPSPTVLRNATLLLARWHKAVRTLDYKPVHQIPHYREIEYFASVLASVRNHLPDRACKKVADKLLAFYEHLPLIPNTSEQLIHGDPKLANMLFRNGRPFTLIDFDDMMLGPTVFDLGDLLRSSLQHAERAGQPLPEQAVRDAVEAYRLIAKPSEKPEAFFASCVLVTRQISLELAMRYLLDIAQEDYFMWDEKVFRSRRDHHMHKVSKLVALCESLLGINKI